MTDTKPISFAKVDDLRVLLAVNYKKQIDNFFGDPKQALQFLSGVVSAVQRTPDLLKCEPTTLINSFMIMAQLRFMPSAVSGEAFVLPYQKGKTGVYEAQFQLGYQGLVTLLYRAGAKSVVAEMVRKNDVFKIVNGSIYHEVDPLKTREERGETIGAYAIITTQTGGKVEKFMRIEEIEAHGKKF
jgi:recombination protein RecT